VLLVACASCQLEELEAVYKAKISAEVDRYDNLIAQRDIHNKECDRMNAQMIQAHEKHVERIKAEHAAMLQEEEVCVRAQGLAGLRCSGCGRICAVTAVPCGFAGVYSVAAGR
jgi:hypothetical protein